MTDHNQPATELTASQQSLADIMSGMQRTANVIAGVCHTAVWKPHYTTRYVSGEDRFAFETWVEPTDEMLSAAELDAATELGLKYQVVAPVGDPKVYVEVVMPNEKGVVIASPEIQADPSERGVMDAFDVKQYLSRIIESPSGFAAVKTPFELLGWDRLNKTHEPSSLATYVNVDGVALDVALDVVRRIPNESYEYICTDEGMLLLELHKHSDQVNKNQHGLYDVLCAIKSLLTGEFLLCNSNGDSIGFNPMLPFVTCAGKELHGIQRYHDRVVFMFKTFGYGGM